MRNQARPRHPGVRIPVKSLHQQNIRASSPHLTPTPRKGLHQTSFLKNAQLGRMLRTLIWSRNCVHVFCFSTAYSRELAPGRGLINVYLTEKFKRILVLEGSFCLTPSFYR